MEMVDPALEGQCSKKEMIQVSSVRSRHPAASRTGKSAFDSYFYENHQSPDSALLLLPHCRLLLLLLCACSQRLITDLS